MTRQSPHRNAVMDQRMANTASLLRYFPFMLLYPLRDNAALVIGLLAFLLWTGLQGLQGIPAFMIALIWAIHYALLVIERTADGYATPPTLGGDALFLGHGPWIKALLLPTAVISGAYALNAAGSMTAATALLGLTAFILPAHWLVLACERDLFAALNPLRLMRVIVAIGLAYLLICAALTLAAGIALWLSGRWSGALFVALVLYLLFMICHLLGFAAYHRHEALGLEVRTALPDEAQRQLESQNRQLDLLLSGIDQKMRQHEAQSAMDLLLADQNDGIHPRLFHEELFERLHARDSVALLHAQGERLIQLLLREKRLDRALEICGDCLDVRKDFFLQSPDDFLRLVRHALDTKQVAVFERMMHDAGRSYPSMEVELGLQSVRFEMEYRRDDAAARIKLAPLLLRQEHALYPQIAAYSRILDRPKSS